MQLTIKHQVQDGLTLPLNYNHILQSIIYHHIRNGNKKYENLHEEGSAFEKRRYKHFTFSLIRGKYIIFNKRITFEDSVEYEIRSADAGLIRAIAGSMREQGITYGEKKYDEIFLEISDRDVNREEIRVRMLSPVCIYSTDQQTGYTHYYAPWEEKFPEMIAGNFRRKYEAYSGICPEGEIRIMPLRVSERDKFITNYKGGYLCGWKGEYLLQGKRKYLDFLYQSGIGSKNSQGFGMFEIIS